jgi:hypothetical protein
LRRCVSATSGAGGDSGIGCVRLLRTLALEMEDAARGQKYMVNVQLIDHVTEGNNGEFEFLAHFPHIHFTLVDVRFA